MVCKLRFDPCQYLRFHSRQLCAQTPFLLSILIFTIGLSPALKCSQPCMRGRPALVVLSWKYDKYTIDFTPTFRLLHTSICKWNNVFILLLFPIGLAFSGMCLFGSTMTGWHSLSDVSENFWDYCPRVPPSPTKQSPLRLLSTWQQLSPELPVLMLSVLICDWPNPPPYRLVSVSSLELRIRFWGRRPNSIGPHRIQTCLPRVRDKNVFANSAHLQLRPALFVTIAFFCLNNVHVDSTQ